MTLYFLFLPCFDICTSTNCQCHDGQIVNILDSRVCSLSLSLCSVWVCGLAVLENSMLEYNPQPCLWWTIRTGDKAGADPGRERVQGVFIPPLPLKWQAALYSILTFFYLTSQWCYWSLQRWARCTTVKCSDTEITFPIYTKNKEISGQI